MCGDASGKRPREFFHEERMRTERYAVQNPAAAHAGNRAGLGSWIRSASFVEIQRDAVVILNEVLILACHIFGH